MNGDTFELWQSLTNDCTYQDKDQSCSEEEALVRVRVVLAAHKREMAAIRDFAAAHSNTVYIVPGNHDVALLFPKVASEVVRAIGAPADRLRIVTGGYWISNDHLIYSEHGQQIGADVNRFKEWPEPFMIRAGVRYLRRPWGEQFVQRYYDQFERKYPIIDNLASETLGVKYGFAAEGVPTTLNDFGFLVRFYLTQQSTLQVVQSLGKNGEGWDVQFIRDKGDALFYESIPDDDPVKEATKRAITSGTLGISVQDLSDDEIRGICASRAKQFAQEGTIHHVTECPKKNFGAVATALVRSRDSIFMDHLNATANRLHKAEIGTGEFQLFIFSHTHSPEAEYSPFQHVASQWMPIVMNTGAWQRTINEQQLAALMAKRSLDSKHVLELQPEDLPSCYPFIVVPPYDGKPIGQLQYWVFSGTAWVVREKCEWQP